MTRELAISLRGVSISYDADAVVHGIDLDVADGELHVLLGASGSGKTTILRAIAGFEPVCAGEIAILGETVDAAGTRTWVPPERRGVGVVFQDYALFPHLDVAGNVGFGMRERSAGKIAALLEKVGLADYGHRPVSDLSGGEQQRVALARALAQRPRVILLDEPFSNLNPDLRAQLRSATIDVLRTESIAGIFVTHDRREAFDIADRISAIRGGALLQTGTPRELYDYPSCLAVAQCVGDTNELDCTVDGDTATCTLGRVPLRIAAPDATILVLRPEQLTVSPDGDNATVRRARYGGGVDELELELSDGNVIHTRAAPDMFVAGAKVGVTVTGPAVAVCE